MTSAEAHPKATQTQASLTGYDRLGRTSLFVDDRAYQSCLRASLLVGGAGLVGAAMTIERVRAGGRAKVVDKGVVRDPFKIGVAFGRPGQPKALAVARASEAVNPGLAEGLDVDLRHLGVGAYASADLIVDATDDPSLAVLLTRISNGTGVPLMRVAVDGSGRCERGRVLISHGSGGHACQLCPWSVKHLVRVPPKTPCPEGENTPPPTIATNATAAVVSGAGLHDAMRLLAGHEDVFDRETIIDLDNMQIIELRLDRSPNCLSGHETWSWDRIDRAANQVTLREAFGLIQGRLGSGATLEAFNHPLWTAAVCDRCRLGREAVGSWWSPPPCRRCGRAMRWQWGTDRKRLTLSEAGRLGILGDTLAALGLPDQGAMLVGRSGDSPPARIVLE
jgi:hypothetical protein